MPLDTNSIEIAVPNANAKDVEDKPKAKSSEKNQDPYLAVFYPYFFLGRFFGASHIYTHGVSRTACFIMLVFTFLLIVYNIGRGISFHVMSNEFKFNPALVFKCILVLYATHCMIAFVMLAKIEKGKFKSFLSYWKEYVHQDNLDEIPYYKWIVRMTKAGIIYAFGISIVNGLFVALGSLEIMIKFPFMESYFIINSTEALIMNGFDVFYTSITFSLSQTLYSSLCFVLACEFIAFDKLISGMSLDELLIKLPALRQKHFHISKLTAKTDEMLSGYAFAIFSLNSPTLIMVAFLLYRNPQMDFFDQFTLGTWVIVLFLQIGVVSIIPAIVNYYAHKPLNVIELTAMKVVDLTRVNSKELFRELTLFLSQLKLNRGIGISGAGFFIITKAMLLTLLSVMFTYFAVILQFDMGATIPCMCIGPCTPVQTQLS